MDNKKTRKIPSISPDRLDASPAIIAQPQTQEERNAHAFVKGREAVQPITIRIPTKLYQELRTIAFKKSEKINQIILKFLKEYVSNDSSA